MASERQDRLRALVLAACEDLGRYGLEPTPEAVAAVASLIVNASRLGAEVDAAAEIARLTRELEEAREREREAATDIDLAWQFVATARRDYQPGDEGYNDCIEQAEDLLWRARKTLVATPDTEGER